MSWSWSWYWDPKSWPWSWSWSSESWSWSWSWDLESWSWSWSWQKSLIYITGYESLNESHYGLRYLRTGASMVQHQSTWHLCCSAFPTYILASDFWPDGATDNSLHHQWTVFPVSSCIHVECSASFCQFFHISVTVQKSTQDRTIRAFIPAILLNSCLRHCDCVTVTQHFCSVILKSLDLRHVNDDSNTN